MHRPVGQAHCAARTPRHHQAGLCQQIRRAGADLSSAPSPEWEDPACRSRPVHTGHGPDLLWSAACFPAHDPCGSSFLRSRVPAPEGWRWAVPPPRGMAAGPTCSEGEAELLQCCCPGSAAVCMDESRVSRPLLLACQARSSTTRPSPGTAPTSPRPAPSAPKNPATASTGPAGHPTFRRASGHPPAIPVGSGGRPRPDRAVPVAEAGGVEHPACAPAPRPRRYRHPRPSFFTTRPDHRPRGTSRCSPSSPLSRGPPTTSSAG
jgi:hypothetical protein